MNKTALEDQKGLAIAAVTGWCAFVLTTFFVYTFFGLSFVGVLVALATSLLAAYRQIPSGLTIKFARPSKYAALVILLDIVLIVWLYSLRSAESLSSPWDVVPLSVLAVYTVATYALLKGFQKYGGSAGSLLAFSLHILISFGLAQIIFAYGFGYDPLIHQAAELLLSAKEKLEPFKPWYLGQYSAVASLSILTRLSPVYIDIFIVPILAAATLPLLLRSQSLGPLVLVLPASALTFTTPYNLTYLYAIWWVLMLTKVNKGNYPSWILWMIAAAAAITHPLIGALLTALTLSYVLKLSQKWISLKVSALIPLLFFLYHLFSKKQFIAISVRDRLSLIFEILPSYTSTLHITGLLISVLFVIAGYHGLKLVNPAIRPIYGGTWVGVFCGALLLAFSGLSIIDGYTLEFPRRVLYLIPVTLLVPLLAYFEVLLKKQKKYALFLLLLICIATSITYYSRYPEKQNAAHGPSKYDVAAVVTIHLHSKDKPYYVIADELLRAVGRRELGLQTTFEIDGKTRHPFDPFWPTADHFFESRDHLPNWQSYIVLQKNNQSEHMREKIVSAGGILIDSRQDILVYSLKNNTLDKTN